MVNSGGRVWAALIDSLAAAFGTLANPIRTQGVGTQDVSIVSGVGGVTVKHAFANVSAGQTDSVLVTGVTSKKIRVVSFFAICGVTSTNLTLNTKGGGAGVAISPLMANAANGGEVLGRNEDGWWETVAGEALTVTTGSGSTTGIAVNYVEV